MKNKFKVLWSSSAEKDINSVIEYIYQQDGLNNAKAIFSRITKTASMLNSYPERGRIVPELKGQGITIYREIIEKPWRLIYRIDAQQVFVFALIDGRRNVEDVLLARLTDTNR